MDKTFTSQNTVIHYTDTGSGPHTVILMHGWGCDASTVESIRAVAARRHRVLTVDFPGHGESPDPPALPGDRVWGVDEYTRAIEELARHESVEAPILIGHSFGGRVAILYASRNAVSKVVLVDAAGVKPRRPLHYYLRVYSFKLSRWILTTFMGARGRARVEAMRAARGSADYRAASPMMRRVLSKVVNEDLKHVMPRIKAPTLLMWGEADTATPVADARVMERLIPDAGLVTFARAGHYSFLDAPGPFATVLDNFINK